MLGLTEKDFYYIRNALSHYNEIEQAIIFGSRAKGNYKIGSDIDLSLNGDKLSDNILYKLADELEEQLPLPYFFDIVNYHKITNKKLSEHIDRVGIKIYPVL